MVAPALAMKAVQAEMIGGQKDTVNPAVHTAGLKVVLGVLAARRRRCGGFSHAGRMAAGGL